MSGNYVVIDPDQLSVAALQGVIEEFITREGTDYGAIERSLADKVEQIRAQLRAGTVQIVFDPCTETCTVASCEK